MHYRAIILCWLCFIISACSPTVIDSCTPPSWQSQVSTLQQSTHWVAQGSAALSSNQQHYMGYFTWIQNGKHFRVDISGPLHVPVATVERTATQTTVRTAETDAPIPLSQWMQQYIGYALPFDRLRTILLGQPKTDTVVWRNNYPYQAIYPHYQVTWQQYHCFPVGYRPQKIRVQLDAGQTLTLFTQDWYENNA